MAFTSPMTAVTGATFTAAQFNTHVRDNLNAIWVGTTAGDMEYYSSATAKTRVAIGSYGQFWRVNSSTNAPEWGALVAARQGGSSTIWTGGGTNNYTPTNALIQLGELTVSATSTNGGVYIGSATVTFPIAYSAAPMVFATMRGSGLRLIAVESNAAVGATQVTLNVTSAVSVAATSILWMSIGPP